MRACRLEIGPTIGRIHAIGRRGTLHLFAFEPVSGAGAAVQALDAFGLAAPLDTLARSDVGVHLVGPDDGAVETGLVDAQTVAIAVRAARKDELFGPMKLAGARTENDARDDPDALHDATRVS